GDVRAADEHTVAAGRDRLYSRVRNGIRIGNRFHFQVVAQDDAVEIELLAQEAANDRRRQRRGLLLVERRDKDVCGHHECDIVANRFAKWHELDTADAIGWMLDKRQREVG